MKKNKGLFCVMGVLLSAKVYSAVMEIDCPDASTVKQTIIQTLKSTNCTMNRFYFYNKQGVRLGSVFVGNPSKALEDCPTWVAAAQKAVITNAGQWCQLQTAPFFVTTCGYNLSNYNVFGVNYYWLALQPVDSKYQNMFNCSGGRLARTVHPTSTTLN